MLARNVSVHIDMMFRFAQVGRRNLGWVGVGVGGGWDGMREANDVLSPAFQHAIHFRS